MHAKVPLSLGVELPLELLVLGIVRSAVRDDEHRLQGTQREGGGEVQKQGQKQGQKRQTAASKTHADNATPSLQKCASW